MKFDSIIKVSCIFKLTPYNLIEVNSMLSRKLKKFREENKLTQEELASKLNVSRSAVAKWEQERGIPDKYSLQDISLLLGISQEELLDEDEAAVVIDNITRLSRNTKLKLIISFLIIIAILLAITILGFMQKSNGNIIDKQISPDGTVTLTVYDNAKTERFDSNEFGFKVAINSHELSGILLLKENCTYNRLYWSNDSRYFITSYFDHSINKYWIVSYDFERNVHTNLQFVFASKIAVYYNIEASDDLIEQISDFQFLEWSDEINIMLVKYTLNYNSHKIIGYFWADVSLFGQLKGVTEISNVSIK